MASAQPCEGLWLTDKIRAFIRKQAALLETAAGSKRGAILVSTGALNPVHSGHVAIMEQARRAVEAEGVASARTCPPRARMTASCDQLASIPRACMCCKFAARRVVH